MGNEASCVRVRVVFNIKLGIEHIELTTWARHNNSWSDCFDLENSRIHTVSLGYAFSLAGRALTTSERSKGLSTTRTYCVLWIRSMRINTPDFVLSQSPSLHLNNFETNWSDFAMEPGRDAFLGLSEPHEVCRNR